MVFRALIRCIRRSLERFKEKRRLRRRGKERDTRLGADMDLEEAIAAQLALQARAGRSLSSTESIAAAIRQSQQRGRNMPSFGTLLENEGSKDEDPDLKAAVMEMQSLTPRFIMNGKQDESPASILNTSTATTTATADDEGVKEDLSASQGPMPRRSSIFNPRKEWI